MPDNNQRRIQSVFPTFAFKDCAQALAWYEQAFGAKVSFCMKSPKGAVVHAEVALGATVLMMSDAFEQSHVRPPSGPSVSNSFYVYVDDVDAFVAKAKAAGAKPTMALTDMFYGDRLGGLVDPFGYHWTFATHKEDVPPAELEKRAQEMFANMAKGQG